MNHTDLPDSEYPGVLVDPLIVLFAARYALGRTTSAVPPAAGAVAAHASVMRERGWADGLLDDIASTLGAQPVNVVGELHWRIAARALLGPPARTDLIARPDGTVPGLFSSPDLSPLVVDRGHSWLDRIDRVVHRHGRTFAIRGQPRARPYPPAQGALDTHIATVLVPGDLRREPP